ncbi:methyl-CpG binding domain protein 3 (predicted), isoform CRA_d [Rattus norvegicus]|uniref:Methyl-CpG binding domain protein 3 (Predicted), isoform CRA_d n=1 Tax=Rattus norvegicus TaxID=10116 RepID=A6K8L0_RAT|nr:methyl-CpG binding domain protein 3 (predicted), isoform CRA_d [Rattus norvegicus]
MERKSPSGKKFRSKPQLARYLGGSMDLSTFDFRTGKMLMNKMNKSRQRVRYDSSNQVKGKPDLNTALPVRQTASIFKPVLRRRRKKRRKRKRNRSRSVCSIDALPKSGLQTTSHGHLQTSQPCLD